MQERVGGNELGSEEGSVGEREGQSKGESAMNVQWIDASDVHYQSMLALRYDTFFKEHGLPTSIVIDEAEARSQFAAVVEDGQLQACGRLTARDSGCWQVSQMAVVVSRRGDGLGSRILRALVERAEALGASEVGLSARLPAREFYQRMNFNARGEIYVTPNTNVSHQWMVLALKRDSAAAHHPD